jgi:hypothetical protein
MHHPQRVDFHSNKLDVDTVGGSLFESANLVCELVNPSSGLHDLNRNEDIHPRKKFE